MRARHLISLAVLVLLGMLAPTAGPATASCAAPTLDAEARLVLHRDEPLVLEGLGFVDGCQDAMSCGTGLGCDDCEYDDPPPAPLQDVVLTLTQGGRSWRLADADAEQRDSGRDGHVTWRFRLPRDVRPGPAEVAAGDHATLEVRIR